MRNQAKDERAKHKQMLCAVTDKHAALEALCSVSEVENKKLAQKLAAQERGGDTLVTETVALEERMRAQDMFTKQLSEDQDKAQEECNALLRELQQVRSQLATKVSNVTT